VPRAPREPYVEPFEIISTATASQLVEWNSSTAAGAVRPIELSSALASSIWWWWLVPGTADVAARSHPHRRRPGTGIAPMGGAAMAKMAATLRFIAPPQGDETCPHTPREEANPAGHPCHYVDG